MTFQRILICIFAAGILACSNAAVGHAAKDTKRENRDKAKSGTIKSARDSPQPMTPAESASTMHLPKGFRIELVASEPLIQEPSCVAFDERGRMFVCELHGYNVEGHIDVTQLNKTGVLDKKVRRIRWELMGGKIAEEAAKRQYGVVKLLTDTNGDGVMDEATVWAKDLPPCYGIVPARGGVIVVCAPDIVYLADRDGDGRAEVRETLFTGFRTSVLERGINNPRWGLDNWIYVGAGGDGGTIRGPHLAKPVELRQTDFRIKPDGSAIEPVNGRVGTFGLTMNDIGDRFPSSGGRPATYALPLPHRYLMRNPHVATPETNYSAATYGRGYRISKPHPWRVKRQRDPAWVRFYGARETNSDFFSGGCSNEFYGDVLFPEEYRGNIFYCEPSLNIVHRCIVERDGAGYKGRRAEVEQQSEFLASTDQWFRPMNLRIGPEGALYIVDMYREIIEDYSAIPRFLQQQYGLAKGGDRGRIWRLAPEDGPARRHHDLSKLDARKLARATGDPSPWRRLTAQRLLIERNEKSAAETLAAQLRETRIPQAAIHAMYTLDGLGKLRASDVSHALEHGHYGVRVHALRLAERWLERDDGLLSDVVAMTDDTDPNVRLQLAMTLGESSDAKAVDALLLLIRQHGSERWMTAAVLSSSHEHAGTLLLGLLRQAELSDGERMSLQPLATTVAGLRDTFAMSQALTTIATLNAEVGRLCLAGFVDGISRGSGPMPESADGWASVSRLLGSEFESVRELTTKLAAKLPLADTNQLGVIFANAAKEAIDAESPVDHRRRAMQVLASASYETLAPAAIRLLDPTQPPALQHAAITSLAASSDERVGAALLANWPSYTPQVRDAVLTAIFARTNRLPALLDSVNKKTVPRADISASQREVLTTNRNKKIAMWAQELFVNPAAIAEHQQRLDRYQEALGKSRNVVRGEQIFAKHCLACHKLNDEGYEVGPPLGSVANKPDETLLLDLLDPSGRIEPEYRSYIVLTEDGRTFTGVLTSESPTSVTLRKEKGVTESILRKEIDIMKASSVSLMPSNIYEQISPQNAADLIAFLRHAFAKSE